jgi:NosR/NirI family nitrous oxide reductase transcriptional regulator
LLFCSILRFALFSPRVQANAYEAELPARPGHRHRHVRLLPCTEVFPGATHFSERKGQPPYVEAYDKPVPTKNCSAM